MVPNADLGALSPEPPLRSEPEVINAGVIVVNAWLVADHSNIPYVLDARSNQYVPSVGAAVGAEALPVSSEVSTLALRTYALLATPKKL